MKALCIFFHCGNNKFFLSEVHYIDTVFKSRLSLLPFLFDGADVVASTIGLKILAFLFSCFIIYF